MRVPDAWKYWEKPQNLEIREDEDQLSVTEGMKKLEI